MSLTPAYVLKVVHVHDSGNIGVELPAQFTGWDLLGHAENGWYLTTDTVVRADAPSTPSPEAESLRAALAEAQSRIAVLEKQLEADTVILLPTLANVRADAKKATGVDLGGFVRDQIRKAAASSGITALLP